MKHLSFSRRIETGSTQLYAKREKKHFQSVTINSIIKLAISCRLYVNEWMLLHFIWKNSDGPIRELLFGIKISINFRFYSELNAIWSQMWSSAGWHKNDEICPSIELLARWKSVNICSVIHFGNRERAETSDRPWFGHLFQWNHISDYEIIPWQTIKMCASVCASYYIFHLFFEVIQLNLQHHL